MSADSPASRIEPLPLGRQARLAFEKVLGYSNHLGLHAEGLGPRGEHVRARRSHRSADDL